MAQIEVFGALLPVALTRREDEGLQSPPPGAASLRLFCCLGKSRICAPPGTHGSGPASQRAPPPPGGPAPSRPHSSGRTCATPGRRRPEGRSGPAFVLRDVGLREPTGASRRDRRGRVVGGRVVGDRVRGPAAAVGVADARLGLGPRAPARAAPAATVMWCLHCNSERTQSLLELELDSG